MDWKILEKIFDHLERCQREGKILQLNIHDDLPKILPLPQKLILDFFSGPFISKIFRLSNDQQAFLFDNHLELCPIDRIRGESCQLSSCEQLHLCENYILNRTCLEFNRLGKCSHSHSLLTHHNEMILEKYQLSSKDDQIFSIISRLIRISLNNSSKILLQTIDQQTFNELDIDQYLSRHRSLIRNQQSINSYTIQLTFDDNEIASMMEDYLRQNCPKNIRIVKEKSSAAAVSSSSSIVTRPLFGRGRGKQEINYLTNSNSFSRRLPPTTDEHRSSLSQRFNSIQNDDERDKSLIYPYRKSFNNEQLSFLLGPGKERIIQRNFKDILPYLPLNSCRVNSIEQGKEIELILYEILPNMLNIQSMNIKTDLSLMICSSAAEKIFEENQTHFAIVTEPMDIQLNIEIIDENSSSMETTQSASTSDGKFHIKSTGSSIDVLSGDITDIPVDLMICISTSNNLRECVLRRAGRQTIDSFEANSRPNDALILDGGLTAARKILFVPWETNVDTNETIQNQKSLVSLVEWCIEQAIERKFQSISFPPIGTGQLGLDPSLVCEAMISAASEQLHQCQLDVIFVIYPTTQVQHEDECYQIFRLYLNSLCEQTPTKNQQIQRTISSKQISIISDSTLNTTKEQNSLIRSLEDLFHEKTFDLSLIKPTFINQIDLLIDHCLTYHVNPRIDLNRKELILRGDRQSCEQCFANLVKENSICQYTYQFDDDDEDIFNPYLSLKIDQAVSIGERKISLKDTEQRIYHIDFNQWQMRFNQNKQIYSIQRKKLNEDNRISIPSSWSSSSLNIRVIPVNPSKYRTLECYQIFEQTMSFSEWNIERIDSIENLPLYLHYMTYNKTSLSRLFYHCCSYSSVQSIIHYGFHSSNTTNRANSICFTRDVWKSHVHSSCRSTDGKYYLFVVEIAKKNLEQDLIYLSNEEIHLILPTFLIVYQKRS